MFNSHIISNRIRILERQFNVQLVRYSIDDSHYVSKVQLEAKRNPKTQKLENLTVDEQYFIQNEILMSRADFRYWFERYPKIVLDDATGEVGHPRLWKAQEIMLSKLGDRELDMHKKFASGYRRFDGNRWYIHKARQMGLSSICQGINTHAVNFYSSTSCLVGSTNLAKTTELHRDYGKMMWSSQPDWMRVPSIKDHSQEGLVLANGSKIVLQHSEMESGFGQGAKWHRSHLTEIASWKESSDSGKGTVSDHIDNHYGPAISRSIKSAAFLESTSQGMDNYWHKNTERARAHKLGWWHYLFIPWWLIPDLYIQEDIPDQWEPHAKTIEEEETIVNNSAEFNSGHTYTPSREQLYWWENQYLVASEKGELSEFYKNYPSIPEQSFTHSGRSSFSYEILTWCDNKVREPLAHYDILDTIVDSELIRTELECNTHSYNYHQCSNTCRRTTPPPPIYEVGDVRIGPVRVGEDERLDPLGLLQVWELPKEVKPFDIYGSVDTTDGIEGWSRLLRRKGDDDINNACISLIRSGSTIDTDILEYAAPVTAKPLARLYNTIARLWTGRNELDGQTPTIVELTGVGMAFQEELISSYNFFAFYQHFRFTGGEWKETDQFGWKPGPLATRHMWHLFKSFVTDKRYIPRSRQLVREMRSCTDDQIYVAGMTRGKAPKRGGRHDDRVYSRAFAIWYANSWANPEPKSTRAPVPRVVSEGPKKLKLHQMDFESPEARESYLAEWDDRVSGYPY